jgi:translation elongation factor EF-4
MSLHYARSPSFPVLPSDGKENRGTMLEQNYVAATRCLLRYKLPLAHLVDDFFGKLKGRTRGYASLDYEDLGYELSDIVKMEVLPTEAWFGLICRCW